MWHLTHFNVFEVFKSILMSLIRFRSFMSENLKKNGKYTRLKGTIFFNEVSQFVFLTILDKLENNFNLRTSD